MSLCGVGIDVASVARFSALLTRYGAQFENRWFHPRELAQPGDRATVLARSFAVKEAVWKALRNPSPQPMPWRYIVAIGDPASAGVTVQLTGALAREAESRGLGPIMATATVHDDWVVAVAIVESGQARGEECQTT